MTPICWPEGQDLLLDWFSFSLYIWHSPSFTTLPPRHSPAPLLYSLAGAWCQAGWQGNLETCSPGGGGRSGRGGRRRHLGACPGLGCGNTHTHTHTPTDTHIVHLVQTDIETDAPGSRHSVLNNRHPLYVQGAAPASFLHGFCFIWLQLVATS